MKLLKSVLGASAVVSKVSGHVDDNDHAPHVVEEVRIHSIKYPGLEFAPASDVARVFGSSPDLAARDCDIGDPSCQVKYENVRIKLFTESVDFKDFDESMIEALRSALTWLEGTLKTVRSSDNLKLTTDPSGAVRAENCQGVPLPNVLKPAGNGVDADFAIVLAAQSDKFCTESTLGWAVACDRDQFEKPIVGLLNVCTSSWKTPRRQHYKTAFFAHEVLHAMGFAADSVDRFLDVDTNEKYVKPKVSYDGPNGIVEYVTTPSVVETVRRHFGCESLIGAALEDEGTSATRGSHLDKRVFGNEGMTGSVSANPVLSSITLALMQDSGWYRPVFSNAVDLVWGRSELTQDWSKEQKCGFPSLHSTSCISNKKSSFGDYFCTEFKQFDSCGFDGNYVGRCIISSYSQNLPPAFQYLSSPNQGGGAYYNYCPIVDSYIEASTGFDSACFRSEQSKTQYFGELYGESSKCIASTLIQDSLSALETAPSRCYSTTCLVHREDSIKAGHLVYAGVELHVESDDGTASIPCMVGEEGKRKGVQAMRGSLTCPNIAKTCLGAPCKYGGMWRENRCVCKPGYVGPLCQFEDNKVNRAKLPAPFYYSQSGSTLKAGSYYEITAQSADTMLVSFADELGNVKRDDITHYVAVSPLPAGLVVDKTTGVIKGTPTAPTDTTTAPCQAFTVAAVSKSGQQYRAVVDLRVVAADDTMTAHQSRKTAVKDLCDKVALPSNKTVPTAAELAALAFEGSAPDLLLNAPGLKVLTAEIASEYKSGGIPPLIQRVSPVSLVIGEGKHKIDSYLGGAEHVGLIGTMVALGAVLAIRM